MKYLNKYNEIMTKYRNGEYGKENLSLYDILEKSNNPDILNRLNLSEIQELLNSTSGMTKMIFVDLKQKIEQKILAMLDLEKDLKKPSINLMGYIEEDRDYLTRAFIMPLEEIKVLLNDFENIVSEKDERIFLAKLIVKYKQDEDIVLKRIIEVRQLVDYIGI